MCDLWLGFESQVLEGWGCDSSRVPIQPVCNWTSVTCDSLNCGVITDIVLDPLARSFNLSGTISSSVGQLTSLTSLVIQNALFLEEGIPPSIGALTNLISLTIGSTVLNGTISLDYQKLTSLTLLDLSDNNLSGTIPDMFYNMRGLSTLNLNNNQLTGNVPPSICALSNVSQVNMYGNKLSCYPTCLLNAPNPGNTLPVADPNALIPGDGGATYGSRTGNLTKLDARKALDPAGNNICKGEIIF